MLYLTNRFHVAVRLFSNRSQMTSKCGKNKIVAHEAIAECVTDVLQIKLFHCRIFRHKLIESRPRPFWRTQNIAIWRKLFSIQNAAISLVAMRSNELWSVQENHATVKRDSKVASRGMKTYSKSIIELQNLHILRKLLEKSKQFLPAEQAFAPKSLDVAVKIAGVGKKRSENLQLWSVLNERIER